MELKLVSFRVGLNALLIGCVLALQACSFLPSTVRDSAASLHEGELQIATDVYPAPSVSAAYGISDQWDVGLDIEEAPSLWARYTFPNQPEGTDVALIGGVFQTRFRSFVDPFSSNYTREDVNGFYIGGIYSHTLDNGSKFNLAYRYNSLYYDAFTTEAGAFETSWIGDVSGSNFEVSDQDLAGIGTASATMSIVVKPQAHFHIGVSCLLLHTLQSNNLDSILCSPVAGVTFFRR
jgi:hypothetical protein